MGKLFDQLVLGSNQRLLFRQFKGRLGLGRPLLCLHQALSRGRLCKSQRLDCRLGNMSGMSSGLTLLVTGTGTGNQMGPGPSVCSSVPVAASLPTDSLVVTRIDCWTSWTSRVSWTDGAGTIHRHITMSPTYGGSLQNGLRTHLRIYGNLKREKDDEI